MNSLLLPRGMRFAAVFVLCCVTVSAQDRADDEEWIFEPSLPFNALIYVAPKTVRTAARLQAYVRDTVYLRLRRTHGDLAAIDGVYREALFLTEGDVGSALLAATGGVTEHYRLGLRIPVIGVFNLPLTLESIEEFRLRYSHLPSSILQDSEAVRLNDKDKLQHFMGSAYIAYAGGSDALAEQFGDWIEVGEESFVVGGRDDVRDRAANALGRRFGLMLLDHPDAVPSDVLGKKRTDAAQ